MTASAALYTLDEAAAILRDTLRDRAYLFTPLGPHVTACLHYLDAEKGRSPRTIESYERHLSRMCLMLAHRDEPGDVTRDDLRGVLASYVAAPGHRRVAWAAMRTFWRFLYYDERIEKNPMERIDSPQQQRGKPADLFTLEEEARLVNQSWIRDRVAVLLLFRAGLRNSELRGLRRRDVDLTAMRVAISAGKGNKPRVVPIAGDVVRALDEFMLIPAVGNAGREPLATDFILYRAGRNRHTVWARPAEQMSESAFNRWWHRLLDDAGVRYRHPHIARHTCLTRLDELGVRAKVIQSIAGHASVQTTFTYYVRSDERDAAEAVSLRERSMRELT